MRAPRVLAPHDPVAGFSVGVAHLTWINVQPALSGECEFASLKRWQDRRAS
jgi:hypothetical protein